VIGALEGEGSLEVGLVTARHRPARVRVVAEAELERSRLAGPPRFSGPRRPQLRSGVRSDPRAAADAPRRSRELGRGRGEQP
jgi:hypothetical protein